MLDTVVIVMNEGFSIMKPDLFEPSAKILTDGNSYLGGRGYIQCKQNPTQAELRAGNYQPRLTYTKRFIGAGRFGLSLKIELSLSKLMYGNNFDELKDSDFDEVVSKLQSILKEQMGVLIFNNVLADAPISTVHYSKNIPLVDGRRPKYWLDRLAEANSSRILDTNKADYRNEGHLFKLHAKSYEVAFYDKIRDLQQAKISDDRAYSRGNEGQLGLFEVLQQRQQFFEVLRFEVRLNTRQKIRSIFKKLGVNSEPTLRGVFSSDQSLEVLTYYLDEIRAKRPALLDYKGSSAKKFMTETYIANPGLGPRKILQLLGMKVAFDEMGMRETRQMLNGYSDRSWYRLVSEVNSIHYPNRKDPLLELRDKLANYAPLHLIDYKDILINNDKYEIN
jgi:hypothetical protein